jgi:hypothetical protein
MERDRHKLVRIRPTLGLHRGTLVLVPWYGLPSSDHRSFSLRFFTVGFLPPVIFTRRGGYRLLVKSNYTMRKKKTKKT